MSYDITTRVLAARAAADQRSQLETEDLRRGKFLRALEDSELIVTDWEAQFIASFLDFTSNRPGDEPRWWTPGRRDAADKMMSHYAEVANQLPAHAPAPTPALPASEPGKCGYLIRGDDRRQHRCNQPATVTLHHGLELCAAHNRERLAQLERQRQFNQRKLR